MAFLLMAALLVGLLLPLQVLGLPPSWRARLRGTAGTPEPDADADLPVPVGDERDEPDGLNAQWGLFTEAFVRERLRALEDELARLDRDPDVFARAFHTIAARSAYDALLVEVTTIAEKPWWGVGQVVDAEVLTSSSGPREVLDL
jgi:hypothetical protein